MAPILESLCIKGLVVEFWIHNRYFYMPSPMVTGIFEFTMMRTGDNGFLRLQPVKKALMSEKLRSSFLDSLKKETTKQNKHYLLET